MNKNKVIDSTINSAKHITIWAEIILQTQNSKIQLKVKTFDGIWKQTGPIYYIIILVFA